MFSSLRSRMALMGPWPRRVLALACLVLAAGAFLSDRPPRAPVAAAAQVVVATHTLPVGHRIAARDLQRRAWPDDLAPPDALARTDSLLGRVVAAPLARGEPVTGRRILGRDLTVGLGPDQVAAVVGVADATAASLIRAGDRVDVLASPAEAESIALRPSPSGGASTPDAPAVAGANPTLLVEDARVLAVLPGTGDLEPATDVVIATSHAAAARVVRARASEMLTILPRSP